MSDDVEDFDMEVVETDDLDELGADSASSSEKGLRSEGRKEEEKTAGEEGFEGKFGKRGNPKSSNSGEAGTPEKMDSNETPERHWADPEATQLERDAFGALPSDWEYVQTSGSLEYIRSGISESQNQDGEGIPVTRIETISDGSVDHEKVGYVEVDPEEADADRLKSGDLLFSNINSREQIGKTAVYRGEKPLYHGMNLLRLRYQEEVLHPLFAYYLYDSPMAKDIFFRIAQAAVGQSSINQGQLKKLSLPRPPLPEQRKIASVLYTVDQAIQKTGAIIEQAQRVKRGLIQDLLTCGIDKDGNRRDPESDLFQSTSLGKFPEAWKLKPLNSIVTESITYGIVQPGPNIPGGVPFIRSGDATADRLDPSSLQRTSEEIAESYSRSRVNAGEIITTIRATVGESHQVPESLDGANLGRGVARIVPEGTVNRRFLLWAMRSGYMDRQFNMYMKGSTYSEITLEQLGKLRVALPDADEQHRIANVLDVQEQNIENEQERLNELRSLKKGLMQDLLTGEVRTADKAIDVLEEVELEEVEAHG
jgi:type I restriction enzyme S subunit